LAKCRCCGKEEGVNKNEAPQHGYGDARGKHKGHDWTKRNFTRL
jgi:hypothetical protein